MFHRVHQMAALGTRSDVYDCVVVHGVVEFSGQLEAMVSKHESLVQKLREECRRLVDELEQLSAKYK